MRIKRVAIVIFMLAAFQLGCAGLEIATSQAEVDAVQKTRTGQYELLKSDELAQLRKDAEIGKSVGRYQMHQIGVRTWRLDTATGTSCLVLAPESDWKKPETEMQACSE